MSEEKKSVSWDEDEVVTAADVEEMRRKLEGTTVEGAPEEEGTQTPFSRCLGVWAWVCGPALASALALCPVPPSCCRRRFYRFFFLFFFSVVGLPYSAGSALCV